MNERPNNFAVMREGCRSVPELQDLTQMLLSEQEEERRMIAADLHDEIGQCLSAIQFALGGLRQSMGERVTEPEGEIFDGLIRRVAKTIDEVRRICMGLRPPMLDDIGIVSTIDWFCGELRQLSSSLEVIAKIRVTEDAIPMAVKVAIFRIVQEACGNACKHSRAHRLSILLETDAEGIRLEVTDDGVGFTSALAKGSTGGLGLATMRQRAEMTNGRLDIRSEVGNGTRILVVWHAQEPTESLTPRRRVSDYVNAAVGVPPVV
jgi:signal transduction histidine kinase